MESRTAVKSARMVEISVAKLRAVEMEARAAVDDARMVAVRRQIAINAQLGVAGDGFARAGNA